LSVSDAAQGLLPVPVFALGQRRCRALYCLERRHARFSIKFFTASENRFVEILLGRAFR
jgi:hypothetical protein